MTEPLFSEVPLSAKPAVVQLQGGAASLPRLPPLRQGPRRSAEHEGLARRPAPLRRPRQQLPVQGRRVAPRRPDNPVRRMGQSIRCSVYHSRVHVNYGLGSRDSRVTVDNMNSAFPDFGRLQLVQEVRRQRRGRPQPLLRLPLPPGPAHLQRGVLGPVLQRLLHLRPHPQK